MPLDIARLRKSKAWVKCKRNPALAFYMINLWTASWHEVPAASLEDDDDLLADRALCDPSKWEKIKEDVLQGWVRCSDGRLYYPDIAEKALESWIEKLANSLSGTAGNAKRWGINIETDSIRERAVQAIRMLRALAPQSKALKKKIVAVIELASQPKPGRDAAALVGDSPPKSGGESGGDSPPDRKGQGQGQGQGLNINRGEQVNSTVVGVGGDGDRTAPDEQKPNTPTSVEEWEGHFIALGFGVEKVRAVKFQDLVKAWVEAGVTHEQMAKAVKAGDAKNKGRPDSPLWYANFLREVLTSQQPEPVTTSADWWKSEKGVRAKGRELGLVPTVQEEKIFAYYRDRVLAAAGPGSWQDERLSSVVQHEPRPVIERGEGE